MELYRWALLKDEQSFTRLPGLACDPGKSEVTINVLKPATVGPICNRAGVISLLPTAIASTALRSAQRWLPCSQLTNCAAFSVGKVALL